MPGGGLLHFFPTPKFLRMPTAGLDLSDDAIRLVELRERYGSFYLESYDHRQLNEAVIDKGSIQKPTELISALNQVREDNSIRFVRVSLPEEKSYLYHDVAPYTTNDEQMRENVSFTIEGNVPLSAREVVFDYDIVADDPAEVGDEVPVVVSVLPVEVVDSYLEVITAGGFQPLSLMVESQAVTRAVVPRDDPDTQMIVNTHHGRVAIYVVRRNAVHFTSAFTPSSTYVPKKASAKSKKGEDPGKVKTPAVDFSDSYHQSLVKEIQRVLDYWHNHVTRADEDQKIKKVLLCGLRSNDPQFKRFLAGQLGLSVRTANVWENSLSFQEEIPAIPADEALLYAAAIGLALPEQV